MAMSKIKKNDTVRVITGVDKGKEGKVIDVKDGKVKVEGINKATLHVKPNQANTKGGIVEEERYFDISNVMLVVGGKTTRVGFREENGSKVRYAKATGTLID
ncbi:MAG: 50S ribosomal protein L24 [Eubacterium sp.]|nr:50S ribosomal protein L24 [Eubacterium sp.]